jgi:hypothetical protein
MGKDSVLHEAE